MKKLDTVIQNFKYNIKLSGITRVHFVKSEWDNPDPADQVSWGYLAYRFLFLTYFLVFLCISLYRDENSGYWLLMATHWSFLCQTIYATVLFCNLAYRFYLFRMYMRIRRKEDVEVADSRSRFHQPPNKLNIWDSITWLLMNVTATVPLVVTVGYWAFVYSPKNDQGHDPAKDVLNFAVHGFNAVLALVDTFVIAIPVRVAHACYTIFFTLLYLLFSCIYEYAGGSYKNEEQPYIYSFLNWREEPGWTVLVSFGAIIGTFVLHVGLWSLYTFRLYLVARFRSHNIYFVKT